MNKMKHINYLLVAILLVVFCMPSFSQKQEKKVKVSSVINKRKSKIIVVFIIIKKLYEGIYLIKFLNLSHLRRVTKNKFFDSP